MFISCPINIQKQGLLQLPLTSKTTQLLLIMCSTFFINPLPLLKCRSNTILLIYLRKHRQLYQKQKTKCFIIKLNNMRLLVFLILIISVTTAFDENIKILISALFDVLNFVESHYYQINFDGLLGVVIAECKLKFYGIKYLKTLNFSTAIANSKNFTRR